MHRPIGSLWRGKRSDPLLRDFVVQVIRNDYEEENLCKGISDSLIGLELILKIEYLDPIWELVPQETPEGI